MLIAKICNPAHIIVPSYHLIFYIILSFQYNLLKCKQKLTFFQRETYMKIGELIRELRVQKNLRANVLYKNLLSRPAIVKFERGESDTTAEKFLEMLDHLNITLEEFSIIYNDGNKDLDYRRKYVEAFYNRDVNALYLVAEQVENEYKLTGNHKFLHYRSLILLLIDDLRGTEEHLKEIELLQDYLMNCDSWGYYEITLFANSLSFYSIELIDLVFERAKTTLQRYQNLTRYRNEIALMIFNILEKKIMCKDVAGAKIYLAELETIKVSVVDNMYMQTMIKFFSAIIAVIDGDRTKNKAILQIIEVFTLLELKLKATQCQEFYEKVTTIYHLNNKEDSFSY